YRYSAILCSAVSSGMASRSGLYGRGPGPDYAALPLRKESRMARRFRAFLPLAFLGALAVSSPAAPPKLADQIPGRWRLVSIESRDDPSKDWERRYGPTPIGYIPYGSDGFMS